MARPGRWKVGSNQYRKRPKDDSWLYEGAHPELGVEGELDFPQEQLADCGVTWDPAQVPVSKIQPSPVDRARARLRAQLPVLIWNDATLEGNTFTLPEVRTLLDGTTVGGKSIHEEQQILALSEAYSAMDEAVRDGTFRLDKGMSDRLHSLLARHEAIEAGAFRGEGNVHGGGHVRLSTGEVVAGTEHGEGGQGLRERMDSLLDHVSRIEDPRLQALVYFASATRSQLYFDGNKRTARLMMTGHLISSGYDAVSVPAARRLELNNALDELFATDDGTRLMAFLADCTLD